MAIQPKAAFSVRIKGLADGVYDLRAALVTPDHRRVPLTHVVNTPRGPVTYCRDVSFRIMARRSDYLESSVRDAGRVLTHAEALGNPARERFPLDDMRDAQARSIHGLQWFDGRIYIGVGDWNENRGPIRIVSFAPIRAGQEPQFRPELTVDDESVDRFRVFGDTLYVPGIDARESWDLGNYYFKRGEQWTKRRTVPNGLHVLDVAEFRGRLYATAGTELGAALYESADDGLTWRRCGPAWPQEGRFWEMAVLADGLLVTSEMPRRGAYLLTAEAPEPLFTPLLPGLSAGGQRRLVSHLERFGDGVVYTTQSWDNPLHGTLYYLGDLQNGALAVECFRGKSVTDVVVRDAVCCVLVVSPKQRDGRARSWRGTVYRSRDLRAWERVADASFPALPSALEVARDAYYVGLANHAPWESADQASGALWRIGE